MMVVEYQTEPEFDPGRSAVLFNGQYAIDPFGRNAVNDDIAPDGQSFVMVQDGPAQEIVVVVNWLEELKRLVPVN